uniref:Fer-1 like family member 4 n=1 Tax=Oryzias melastigma TaxID=30732 RepID=A0A3B3D8C6_ORYME
SQPLQAKIKDQYLVRTHQESDFRWPHYGKDITEEVLHVSVYNCNVFFQIYVELDIRFQPVEGAPGRWKDLDFVTDEDNQYDYSKRWLSRVDLQVNVNILEAQKLVGVNINPAVFIRVGGQERNTATQKSTNCPFYNENFQFEFQEVPQIFSDEVIEIKVVLFCSCLCDDGGEVVLVISCDVSSSQVFHRRTLAFLMTHIGTFKIDRSSSADLSAPPDHSFYQKWAPLTDPGDTRAGVKGYVKASLSVLMKGDALHIPSMHPGSSLGASDDIEKNLLLPRGLPSERPWARFRVQIFRAEGLPTMEAGLMAKMSVSDRVVFIDPYVQVTFAGQQGETSVSSASSCPVWNEEVSFIEQFPPLAQRIKIQILDDSKMGDVALATHFLDLQQISDPTRDGFNPTFGPSWVNLYGSPQNSTLGDVHQALNEGVGEGIFYRGRILLALSMEVYSSPSTVSLFCYFVSSESRRLTEESEAGMEVPESVTVEIDEIHPLPEGFLGQKEEFLLFASLFEVTMVDPSVGTKPLTFELSIGEIWLFFYSRGPASVSSDSHPAAVGSPVVRSFQCLRLQPPSNQLKPCLFVWAQFEDHSFRLHQANWLSKMADRLELGVDEVERLLKRPRSKAKERLVEVLLELVASCKGSASCLQRSEGRRTSILQVSTRARQASDRLVSQPQSTIPDAFLWLLTGSKRLAYVRIPAHSILFSVVEEQKGRDCGCITTLYLKSPGCLPSDIFAKLEVYLWLGPVRYCKEAVSSLPQEFTPVHSSCCSSVTSLLTDSRYFQLRCHLYQGRGLRAADDDGLSDPFAKVVFSTQCQRSRTMMDTLTPSWSQCLLFDRVLLEGTMEQLQRDPPLIIINIYDYDTMGSPKPLGQAFAKPEFKTVEQVYEKPRLSFYDISKGRVSAGELLAAFELIEFDYSGFGEVTSVHSQLMNESERFFSIPEGVRPVLKTFRIEVLFWGLRELKRVQLFEVERPMVKVECAGEPLKSEEIQDYRTNPNFKQMVGTFSVGFNQELPEQSYLHPPLTLFVVEHRAFGHLALVGTHVVLNLMEYGQRDAEETEKEEDGHKPIRTNKSTGKGSIQVLFQTFSKMPLKKMSKRTEELEEEEPEEEELDWWSKYYASLEEQALEVSIENQRDLESEFNDFQDWLKVFPLYKGRASTEDDADDDEDRLMGKFKGSFLVYPIDPEDKGDPTCQITSGIPKNVPVKVLVRVYIVKATSLAPADPNGKADPYLVVKVGNQSLDSKDRYIPKQLNPTFGEVFELSVSFPLETELIISVMDHDLIGSDDIIGETRIDLENRFYSRHRASCGLALLVVIPFSVGYNMWRDAKKPSTILAELCRKNGIPFPEYRTSEVKVLQKIFKIPADAVPEEHAALYVLHHWGEMEEFLPGAGRAVALVPEHVEVRSLLTQDKPGQPQGHLHLWVDMFPTDIPAPPPVDIKPRLPERYELRVIIWNTDDVFLDDVNPFTGDPSSDIYVKGWIKGLDGDKQETDVHFNSLTGEGNFNWRFVFRFDYLPTEKEVVFKKKESIFSLEESEFREPAVLMLQAWDYDRISSNDFLGSIELRLSEMVRPAKTSSKCTIEMAKDRATPRFSIFRAKKMKGWWPLVRMKTAEDFEKEEKEKKKSRKKKKTKDKRSKLRQEDIQYTDNLGNTFLLMGKVEAELQLVTLEQAEANPVGRGRKEPEPLDKPNRPTTSFNWFINPMKTFVFLIWKNYKKYIIALLIILILTLFLVLIFYTLPGEISSLIVKG